MTAVVLVSGDARAEISRVGASLAALSVGGRALVAGFAFDEMRPVYRGALLAPWPNRIVDGRYEFDGVRHELAVSEPARGHALHGLVAWQEFEVAEQAADRVVLTADVVPQTGYPWRIGLRVEFALGAAGLQQTVSAVNRSESAAPYGVATHHYLVADSGSLDDWHLTLPAERVMLADGDRLLPGDTVDVAHDPARFDFRVGRPIGSAEIDHAFETAGAGSVLLTDPAGVGVRMEWDARSAWVQVHTADRPEPELHRAGLAVEPMTCAPDAFNSGSGLVRLEPGETHTAWCAISAVG